MIWLGLLIYIVWIFLVLGCIKAAWMLYCWFEGKRDPAT